MVIKIKYPDDYINKIICGDHLVILKDIPDNIIDLTVTSPPYDKLRDYKGYIFNFEKIAKELYRVTKKGGHNTKENVVPACRSCNAKKYNKLIKPTTIL